MSREGVKRPRHAARPAPDLGHLFGNTATRPVLRVVRRRKGTILLVLEAMKMENEIQASGDGVVDSVFVEPGQTVESGAELAHIAPPV